MPQRSSRLANLIRMQSIVSQTNKSSNEHRCFTFAVGNLNVNCWDEISSVTNESNCASKYNFVFWELGRHLAPVKRGPASTYNNKQTGTAEVDSLPARVVGTIWEPGRLEVWPGLLQGHEVASLPCFPDLTLPQRW